MLTEAGARVGKITLDGTMFLVLSSAIVLGPLGGPFYVAIRRWLPASRWWKTGLVSGLLLLVINGNLIIEGGNFDFIRFGPAWLTVLMFASLFVFFGLLAATLAARLEQSAWVRRTRFGVQLALVIAVTVALFVFAFPLVRTLLHPKPVNPTPSQPSQFFMLLSTMSLSGLGILAGAAAGENESVWGGQKTLLIGYVLLGLVSLAGAYFLAQSILQIFQAAAG